MTWNIVIRTIALVIGAVALLIGCAGPTVVVMKNPATGEIVQCKGANTGLSVWPRVGRHATAPVGIKRPVGRG
jgi:hypothetical protein